MCNIAVSLDDTLSFCHPEVSVAKPKELCIFAVPAQVSPGTAFSYVPFIQHQILRLHHEQPIKSRYTGITNGLLKRVIQHKLGINEG